ncbi:MAG: alpha-ketoglutarate-dependent dioxygenase AlkB [Methylocystis sp.]|nr:alpha-ketoglutarate-dependent dioxygenase AlkB [Methylocystis sp.]
MSEIAPGAFLHRGFLDEAAQESLTREITDVITRAPLFVPRMPRTGKPFSVRMTNCGSLGWVSDARGYRYEPRHPETGEPWPAMPRRLLEAWKQLANYHSPPEACLVNFYGPKARMGLHQDRDEQDLEAPLVSLSLGASCRFRLGGARRADPTRSFVLASGDALVLSGPARLCFHGVDRILPSLTTALASPVFEGGARINLTLRRVT